MNPAGNHRTGCGRSRERDDCGRSRERDGRGRSLERCAAAAIALVIAALASAPPASADETFVCEDGSIVTVLPGQLEAMKRSDPCVAAYFRNNGQPAAAVSPGQFAAPEGQPAALAIPAPAIAAAPPIDPPLPGRRPDDLEGADAIASKLRTLEGDPSDMASAQSADKPMSMATAAPAAAAVASDFRNVYILNAPKGADRYYHHNR